MRKSFFILTFFLVGLFFLSASVAHADTAVIDPGDKCPGTFTPLTCPVVSGAARCNTVLRADGSGCFENPCTTCHLLALAGHILSDLIAIAVLLAVVLFVYAGWILLTTPIADHISRAKRIFWNTFFGLIVILAAWLIVDTILSTVASGGKRLNGITFSQYFCSDTTNTAAAALCEATGFAEVPVPPPIENRICREAGEGPCTPENLALYFGAEASHASQICIMESGGIARSYSRTDISLSDGQPFSVGLFQINMVTTNLPAECGGYRCSDAYARDTGCEALVNSGDPPTCARFPAGALRTACLGGHLNARSFCSRVVNPSLRYQCAYALLEPGCNAAAARQIYGTQGWNGWKFSSEKCGF